MAKYVDYNPGEWCKRECLKFFAELVEALEDTHELVASCNNDNTMYLVPKGTADQITYNGKPDNSYRFSDHWNWYANTSKCQNEKYIQCWNVDMPRVKDRPAPGKPSSPIFASAVAKIGKDGKYHTIFGEKWSKNKKEWSWYHPDSFEEFDGYMCLSDMKQWHDWGHGYIPYELL